MSGRAHAVAFESGVAEAVVGGALLRILQRFIGLVDLFEALLGSHVARITVGMIGLGKLAEGVLYVLIASAARYTKGLVITAFRHDCHTPSGLDAIKRQNSFGTDK